MQIFESKYLGGAYLQLIETLLSKEEINGTKEINNCCLVIHEPVISRYYFPRRHISEDYSKAELEWYWSGDNRCETIGQHAKMWLRLSDDGVTNNSAYGYILQKKYPFNQIEQAIDILSSDKYSRRAILNISDPAIDKKATKDLQCTIAIQFLIRNDKLETTVYMRSNDVYFGFPYDYIYFTSIAAYVAKRLNLELGTYTHHATSMHMYAKDYEKFKSSTICTPDVIVDVFDIIERNYKYEKMEHSGFQSCD